MCVSSGFPCAVCHLDIDIYEIKGKQNKVPGMCDAERKNFGDLLASGAPTFQCLSYLPCTCQEKVNRQVKVSSTHLHLLWNTIFSIVCTGQGLPTRIGIFIPRRSSMRTRTGGIEATD